METQTTNGLKRHYFFYDGKDEDTCVGDGWFETDEEARTYAETLVQYNNTPIDIYRDDHA